MQRMESKNATKPELKCSVGMKTLCSLHDVPEKKSSRSPIMSFIIGIKTSSSHSLTSVESDDSFNAVSADSDANDKDVSSFNSLKIEVAEELPHIANKTPSTDFSQVVHPIVPIVRRKRGKLPRKSDIVGQVDSRSNEEMRMHLMESSGAIKTKEASFKEHSRSSHKVNAHAERIMRALTRSSSSELASFSRDEQVLSREGSREFFCKPDEEFPVRASTVQPLFIDGRKQTSATFSTTSTTTASITASTSHARPHAPSKMEALPNRTAEVTSVRKDWLARVSSCDSLGAIV